MIHSASLINDPAGDPGVYVELKYRREALLFDLGDLQRLPPRKLLKIDFIFVSHTHMDHFIGFDHLLRISLGRDRLLRLFGPPGFLGQVESKLRAYTWNLVANYTNDFELEVTEVHPVQTVTRRYRCRSAFAPEGEQRAGHDGTLVRGEFFAVRTALLDHGTPCLAFCFEEQTRINIKSNVLREMGLPTGAWLMELKAHIMRGEPDDLPVRAWWRDAHGRTGERQVPLGLLRQKAVKIAPGQKIAYVTDVLYSEENARRIIGLCAGAELIFIEAPFLDDDADTAARKYHLTARQAGLLAARAGAKRMVPFHFSPKYKTLADLLQREATRAFQDAEGPCAPPAGALR
ncbi:MAG: MBL fold metallo-hydrolase [Thermodesulfobacteriota bacterium]